MRGEKEEGLCSAVLYPFSSGNASCCCLTAGAARLSQRKAEGGREGEIERQRERERERERAEQSCAEGRKERERGRESKRAEGLNAHTLPHCLSFHLQTSGSCSSTSRSPHGQTHSRLSSDLSARLLSGTEQTNSPPLHTAPCMPVQQRERL